MSADMTSERVCYLQCNFCNTILAVNVPCNSLLTSIVTVRCGHCANLLSVNMGALLHSAFHLQSMTEVAVGPLHHQQHEQPRTPPIRPPEKRQRVPSAYNRFIKDEIQRIKASNPEISHREAFSTAAKNWAHFPRISLGQRLHLQDQANNQAASAATTNIN